MEEFIDIKEKKKVFGGAIPDDEIQEIDRGRACRKFELYIKEIEVFFEERLMESVEEEQKQQRKIEKIIAKEEQVTFI